MSTSLTPCLSGLVKGLQGLEHSLSSVHQRPKGRGPSQVVSSHTPLPLHPRGAGWVKGRSRRRPRVQEGPPRTLRGPPRQKTPWHGGRPPAYRLEAAVGPGGLPARGNRRWQGRIGEEWGRDACGVQQVCYRGGADLVYRRWRPRRMSGSVRGPGPALVTAGGSPTQFRVAP